MAFRKPTSQPRVRLHATLSRLILEKLGELGETTISSFFPAKYPEARLWRSLLGLEGGYTFRRETFPVLLCRLRAQKLVERVGLRQHGIWRITGLGKRTLQSVQPVARARPDGTRRLVIFDIPERERKKRDAIRLELVAAGFQQLQKSVWHGEHPLPENFLELINALNLKNYVHVFSVRNPGTLTRE